MKTHGTMNDYERGFHSPASPYDVADEPLSDYQLLMMDKYMDKRKSARWALTSIEESLRGVGGTFIHLKEKWTFESECLKRAIRRYDRIYEILKNL